MGYNDLKYIFRQACVDRNVQNTGLVSVMHLFIYLFTKSDIRSESIREL